jgi:hypothetical protein
MYTDEYDCIISMADAEADTDEKSVTRERPVIAAGGTDSSTGRS